MTDAARLLRARWVFPVDQPPIADGVIEIVDGRIARLGSGPDPDAVDLGDVALIPGLVNAHTHLEFSHLAKPLGPAAPFEEWIHSVCEISTGTTGASRRDHPSRSHRVRTIRNNAAGRNRHLGSLSGLPG